MNVKVINLSLWNCNTFTHITNFKMLYCISESVVIQKTGLNINVLQKVLVKNNIFEELT